MLSEDNRIAEIEADVAGLQVNVQAILRKLDEQSKTLQALMNNNRTNWATLAAWATVVLALMVYHGQLTSQPLKQQAMYLQYEIDQFKALDLNTRLTVLETLEKRGSKNGS